MKVFISGIATETNTFAPFPTSLMDFKVIRAEDIESDKSLLDWTLAAKSFIELGQTRGWECVFGLWAFAQPAGVTIKSAYETLRDEMLEALAAALPVDAVLLDLHGAMVVQGYDDCEEDMVARVREIVGPDVVIGVELDPHCHLTQQFIDTADVVVIYKEYPHIDIKERAQDLVNLVERTVSGEIHPTMALFDCRMIGTYRTVFEPMRSFVDSMMATENKDGILSLSLGHCFPWGDVPHLGTKMLATTDNDLLQAQTVAESFGRRFVSLRNDVDQKPLTIDAAISEALATEESPVVLADVTDNPGGGAPSDSTFLLRALLEKGVTGVALGMIWDPIVVQIAGSTEIGTQLNVRLGGKMGAISGDPLDLRAEVIGIIPNMMQEFAQADGQSIVIPCGNSVALRCEGIKIVVNSQRTQVYSSLVFTNFGIDVREQRILVVKSTQHFYADFSKFAAKILYVSAPGALQPDYREVQYSVDHSSKYPWTDDPFKNDRVD